MRASGGSILTRLQACLREGFEFMNRTEFMSQLEQLLRNITPAEREEALQYYNDYFDDAGAENEQEVIEALGNPARVAENIKRDLPGNTGENMPRRAQPSDRAVVEYGKTGTEERYFEQDTAPNTEKEREAGQNQVYSTPAPAKKGMPGWAIVLITIALIFASPVLLGLAIGLLGVLFGVLVTWFALIFAVVMVMLSMFIVLIVLCAVGEQCLVVDPLVGIALIGGGLICGGIGILFLMLAVAMAGIVTPAVFRGIWRLFRGKKKEATV